ncbi:hypothetical protein FHR87_003674 [Azomonas macrocytogenes]|uniref:Uncharacterized protein n=1 Tax=Azomonas macrocytogenes TaxID=69962 RepID=A0A839T810_AZOMA|nr:hypothetical protein [Azomonas macrocytogenes]
MAKRSGWPTATFNALAISISIPLTALTLVQREKPRPAGRGSGLNPLLHIPGRQSHQYANDHQYKGNNRRINGHRQEETNAVFAGLAADLAIAVKATNSTPENSDDVDLSFTACSSDDDHEPMDPDTRNTHVGRLVDVFLEACPSLTEMPNPFDAKSNARQFRDVAIGALDRSGLIVRRRLIEELPYFLRADSNWTQQHLIAPLLKDDAASLAFWHAIARRTHFTKVLEIIGDVMAEKANDRRLGRETRQKLVFSLVIVSI